MCSRILFLWSTLLSCLRSKIMILLLLLLSLLLLDDMLLADLYYFSSIYISISRPPLTTNLPLKVSSLGTFYFKVCTYSIRPKVCEHINITSVCDSCTFHSKTTAINSAARTPSTLQGRILDPGWRDLLPFSQKSISEVQHWCWVRKPGSQSAFKFIPKVLDMDWGQGSVQVSQVIQSHWGKHLYTGAWSCWNGKKTNTNCCLKVGQGCPHTFDFLWYVEYIPLNESPNWPLLSL